MLALLSQGGEQQNRSPYQFARHMLKNGCKMEELLHQWLKPGT